MSVNSKELAKKTLRILDMGAVYRNKFINIDPNAELNSKGLSSRQLEILFRMFVMNKNTVTDLAECMDLSKSTVSILTNKLIKKGFVTRNYPNEEDDKRKIYFYLSEQGEKLINSFSVRRVSEFLELYSNINTDKKVYLEEAAAILSQLLEESTFEFYDKVFELIGSDAIEDKESANVINMLVFLSKLFMPIIKAVLENNAIEEDITEKQFKVLAAINYFGYNTVTKLENYFLTSGSSVSIIVQKLEKAGYLIKERNKCKEDHRITYLCLTENGQNVLNKLFGLFATELEKAFENKSEGEREKLESAFDKIIQAIT